MEDDDGDDMEDNVDMKSWEEVTKDMEIPSAAADVMRPEVGATDVMKPGAATDVMRPGVTDSGIEVSAADIGVEVSDAAASSPNQLSSPRPSLKYVEERHWRPPRRSMKEVRPEPCLMSMEERRQRPLLRRVKEILLQT